jgi:predicted P-loop ATPase
MKSTYGPLTEETARRLLDHISPNCDRDIWLRIGAALRHELGDGGYALFDDWSRGAPDLYDKYDAINLWKSLDRPKGRKCTAGTLYHHAKQGGWKPPGAREAGVYIYENGGEFHHRVKRMVRIDAQGRDIFDKNEKPKKDFPIEHWKGKQWVEKEGDVERILYHVQEVREALAHGEMVFWTEGEAKTDALRKLGLVATTTIGGSGGAKTLWQHQYGREFKAGDHVIALPDHDEAGEKYLNAVGSMLAEVDAEMLVLRLPGLGEAEDVVNWLARGGTKEELLRLATEAELWVMPAAPEVEVKETLRDGDWEPGDKNDAGYLIGKHGQVLTVLPNMVVALQEMPELKGLFRWDEFNLNVVATRPVSNVYGWTSSETFPRPLSDSDETMVNDFLQRKGMLNVAPRTLNAAIHTVARSHAFHPVRDYLNNLKWDNTERVDTWLHSSLGAEKNAYTAAIGRMFLISMVARIYQPGCKVDYTLILEGTQGRMKSWALSLLASPWFSDDLPDIHSKDAKLHLGGKWLIEIAELLRMQKADINAYKAYITRTTDIYRPPYGRNEIIQPRQCVFAGTTNQDQYLTDETGNRRSWPVKCGEINLETLEKDRDQLFAEVVKLYSEGVHWWPDAEFEQTNIVPEQRTRVVHGVFDEEVQEILWTHYQTDQPSLREIARKMFPEATSTNIMHLDMRLSASLKRLGWVRTGKQNESRQRVWEPGPLAKAKPSEEEGAKPVAPAKPPELGDDCPF